MELGGVKATEMSRAQRLYSHPWAGSRLGHSGLQGRRRLSEENAHGFNSILLLEHRWPHHHLKPED